MTIFGLFVVQRHQVGGGEHVGIAAVLQEVGQCAQVVLAVDARSQRQVQGRRPGAHRRADRTGVARSQRRRQAQDVGARGARVGADHAHGAVALFAQHTLPLDAELRQLVGVDFDDQAFDQHLRAAPVELVDHGAQLAVLRLGRGDDERVGGRVGLDLPAGGRLGAGRHRRGGGRRITDCP